MQDTLTQIPVIHIEDEPDWVDIIQSIINRNFDYFDYRCMNIPVDEAINRLSKTSGPAIILWDLRLSGQHSEIQTTLQLSEIINSFNERCLETFVLSGFLHERMKYALLESGIPENHIFEKGRKFSRQEFVDNLKLAEDRLRGYNPCSEASDFSVEGVVPDNSETVCEITSRFLGFEEHEEPLLMKPDKIYEFSVSLTSLFNPGADDDLRNNSFDIGFYCPAAKISQSSLKFKLPPFRKVLTHTINVSFVHDPDFANRNFFVLVYHNNALIQSAVFHLKILQH
jgi:hypothetical protein